MRNGVSDSTAGGLSDADIENQQPKAGGVEVSENAVGGQSVELVEKVVDVVVVDCTSKGDFRDEGDSDATEECREEDGSIRALNKVAIGQSQNLVENVIDLMVEDHPTEGESRDEGDSTAQKCSKEECGLRVSENAAVGQLLVDCPNKGESRDEGDSNAHEECRICQEETEECLIDIGCHCRGALAKAHRSCITTWFQAQGSNKCEICQQVASNVAPLDPQTSYWIWRVNPAYATEERERTSFKFIWAALLILIGGLLLDVMISISFGVSALPTNIIIGVIIVLGLGTALRLALEFFREWYVRRGVQRVEVSASLGYHPAL